MNADIEPHGVRKYDDGTVECVYRLPRSYPGFDGHFPGDPVLPGMCHIDLALRTVAIAIGARCKLGAIVQARFFRKVRPDDELRSVVSRGAAQPGCEGWRVRHFVNAELAAEILLLPVRVPAPPDSGDSSATSSGSGWQ